MCCGNCFSNIKGNFSNQVGVGAGVESGAGATGRVAAAEEEAGVGAIGGSRRSRISRRSRRRRRSREKRH